MYAISKDRSSAFMFDPAFGLDIPLHVEFANRQIFIEYPNVVTLEMDFEVVANDIALRDAAGENGPTIEKTVKMGQDYSRLFAQQIAQEDTTLRDLAQMIIKHQKTKDKFAIRPSKVLFRRINFGDNFSDPAPGSISRRRHLRPNS